MGGLLAHVLPHFCAITRIYLQSACHITLFNVFNGDRQLVKQVQNELDHLDRRVRLVRIQEKPLLKDGATRVVKEHTLVWLILKQFFGFG